jgi:hypothetical protein
MCFNVRNNIESATLWVAKQDIVCYKRFKYEMYSPYRDFKYKLDKLYKAKIGKPTRTCSFIEAKSTKDGIILDNNIYVSDPIFEINRGLHSYSSLYMASKKLRIYESLYKCIIPKGSEFYYDNVDKEYVSNQLIVKKKLKTI